MVRYLFTNNAETTLDGAINNSVTSLSVNTGDGALFPASNFKIQIDTEVILVGSRSTDTFNSLTRGHDNTTAASHSDGASLDLVASAEDYTDRVMGFPVTVPGAGQDEYFLKYDHDTLSMSFANPDHDTIANVSADDHHPQQHAIDGADHTASGLTIGHVLRASGATTFAFAQLSHSDLGGVGTDDHHAEAHTVASHSDTTATGTELNTLTDGSNADALHTHAGASSEEYWREFLLGGM